MSALIHGEHNNAPARGDRKYVKRWQKSYILNRQLLCCDVIFLKTLRYLHCSQRMIDQVHNQEDIIFPVRSYKEAANWYKCNQCSSIIVL